jgi:ribosomal-protein-alanine N-acetyltransferase
MPELFDIPLPSYPVGYEIRTDRLTLSASGEFDAEGLFPMMSDPRLTTYLAWEPHYSIEDTREVLRALAAAQRNGTGFHWTVKSGEQPVGIVSLIDVRRRHRSWTINRAELAYWIGIPFQGHGFATEAASAVLGFAFGSLGFHKLFVYHAATNFSSSKTVEKLRFRSVGVEKEAFFKLNAWHDLKHYELLATDFSTTIQAHK